MFWSLFLLPLVASAPLIQRITVGEIFETEIGNKSRLENVPDWMDFEHGILSGIAKKADLGRHVIEISTIGGSSNRLELIVSEEETNPCGEAETTWVEVIYADDLKVEKRIEAAHDIAKKLSVSVQNLRVYDYDYSRKIRKLESIGGDEKGAFTIIKPSCDDSEIDAIDLATDDMDKLLEDDYSEDAYSVTILKGHYLPVEKSAEDAVHTTTMRTTSQRTTRHASLDNAPVRLNSINSIKCTRGILCETLLPVSTFKDAEDGDTYQLTLKIVNQDGSDSWLFYEDKMIQGVPLKTGEFQMRMEARDKKGQMAAGPFTVSVVEASQPNHQVIFEMDLKNTQDLSSQPDFLTAFVKQIASIFKSKPSSVAIQEIRKEKGKTMAIWSNSTLPTKVCSESGIQSMRSVMMTKQRKTISRMFEKAMTERFNLRRLNLELTGNCIQDEPSDKTSSPDMESAQTSEFPWTILLAVLAVLAIVALILVCVCHKSKNKKEKPSEYVSKGMPVVFPEEVVDDSETAHAATPMLTKEERPPLKISQHENPLYKPPPPLVASSPRIGTMSSTNPNQRMPPPYVPP